MNARLARRDYFWASSSYSAVALQGRTDIVDKAAYVLANPVASGLVRRGRQWPGIWFAPLRCARHELEFERPAHFFRRSGPRALPDRTSLNMVAPPGFDSVEEFAREVAIALESRESSAETELRAAGRCVLGVAAVLAQRPFARPRAWEPLGGLNPRVASKDKKRRTQALADLVEFLHAYRVAFARWRGGALDAVFPQGTYLMRVLHGASCATPT
jgi:hypothetical protein